MSDICLLFPSLWRAQPGVLGGVSGCLGLGAAERRLPAAHPGAGARRDMLARRNRGWGGDGESGIHPFPDAPLLPRSAACIPALRSAAGRGVKESGHRDTNGAGTVREQLRSSERVFGRAVTVARL